MSVSKELHNYIITTLKNLAEFKDVYDGIVPPPQKVRNFPSLAVDFAVVNRKKGKLRGCMEVSEEIDIYIYNTQASNKYEDIVSDLVEVVDNALRQDSNLKERCIDNYIMDVRSDAGILHPRTVVKLTLLLRYYEYC